MATLIQSLPQPSSTVTMLQTRPQSSAGGFPNGVQGQQHARLVGLPRNMYNTPLNGTSTSGSYRGQTPTTMTPYAHTSTPTLTNPHRQNPAPPHLSQEKRTTSAPVLPHTYQPSAGISPSVSRNLQSSNLQSSNLPISTASSSTSSSINTSLTSTGTRDDSFIPTQRPQQTMQRPLSSIELNSQSLSPSIPLASPSKPSPDRYRRVYRRAETTNPAPQGTSQNGSALPSGSGMATVGYLYNNPIQSSSTPSLSTYPLYRGATSPLAQAANYIPENQPRLVSRDDMNLQKQPPSDLAKRYRRRSISGLDAAEYNAQSADALLQQQPQVKAMATTPTNPSTQEHREHRVPPSPQRPVSSHDRNNSGESANSIHSQARPSSAKRDAGASYATANSATLQGIPIAKHEAKIVNIPARGSSDVNKKLNNPSPLSRPTNMGPEPTPTKDELATTRQSKQIGTMSPTIIAPQAGVPDSPAAQHLAALNKKDGKKEGKSSRLRRAFSFGSAAELRKASAENSMSNNASTERAKLRKERYQEEQDAEQAAIAQKQEASGLGAGIYSGQGQFFTGSTDNLSISSTASSASVMIRKMGKGMKKSTRSLVGLFRPKSVIGVPASEAAIPEPSFAQVSMVTVEAEREKVNVNINPHDQAGGGTGFPKLERNSMETSTIVPEPRNTSSIERPRRSIVGGEKERAEVLAAVKKGILKRGGTDSSNSSPVLRPQETKASDFVIPPFANFSDSPHSSAPTTPKDDQPFRPGHSKSDSVTIEGEDYFMSIAKFASGDSKSLPGTPRSLVARNISFSPRIQFHDTWPSGEYDRRGEIATCNRLTPMLAQQIKEELNTFKMEMEVHEQSKVYTHFF